ncbi:hypothetical protein BJX99DRAFT_226403 [Aspergillus californicus]
MSGLKLAGIVIGAIPIVIAAMDKYRERQSRIAFRSKEPFILRVIQSLKTQHYLLFSDIQITLRGAGVEYDRSTVQSNASIFQDQGLKDAVDDYLGTDSAVYYDAVDRCYMVLAGLVGSIEGLGPMPQGLADLVKAYPPKGGQYEIPKKIKFPMKRDALDKQISDLENSTTALWRIRENMTALSLPVTLEPASRQLAAFASALNTVRNDANRLYSAILTAFPTHCHSRHEARLFLRSRCDIMDRKKNSKQRTDMVFTVLLSPEMSTVSTPSYRTDIRVMRVGDTVREHSTTIRPQTTIVIRPPTPPTTPDPPQTAMNDLCRSIQLARDGGVFLDLHLAKGACLTYCNSKMTNSNTSVHLVESMDGFVSLKQLLEDKSSDSWTPIHRMVLSLVVASSLLQLVSTPWLRLPLKSSFVRFSKSTIKYRSLSPSTIPEPFVEERFASQTAHAQQCKDCTVREYMLELGILLLEIEYWKTLEDYKQDLSNSGQSPPDNRYILARSWLDSSMLHILPVHLESITRCIEFTFAFKEATPSWDDVVLRKSITEYVLKPLQDNCPQQLR